MTLILTMIGSRYIVAGGGGGGVTLSQPETDLSTTSDTSQLSTYTFNINAGVGGLVGVTLEGRPSSNATPAAVSSVTIDGVTAILAQPYNNENMYGAIAYATGVSSGTVAVVVNLTESGSDCIWNPFTITNFSSSTPNDSFHVSDLVGGATSLSSTLDILSGGCVVALAAGNYNITGNTIAFTGVDMVDNTRVGSTAHVLAVGGIDGLAVETGRTITADFTPTGDSTSADLFLTAVTWS
jgi:hypothetical protein